MTPVSVVYSPVDSDSVGDNGGSDDVTDEVVLSQSHHC